MWEDLIEALIRRLGGMDRATVFEKLIAVRQKGEVGRSGGLYSRI